METTPSNGETLLEQTKEEEVNQGQSEGIHAQDDTSTLLANLATLPEEQLKAKNPNDDEDLAYNETKGELSPSALIANRLLIGSWLLKGTKPLEDDNKASVFTVIVRLLTDKHKIKYEIMQPGSTLLIDYDFSRISGIGFKLENNIMMIELSEPPNFSAKENGKWVKVLDFTQGNASYYRRHCIEFIDNSFISQVEAIFAVDPKLRDLAALGLPDVCAEPAFTTSTSIICDWDAENIALVHCEECGQMNYCTECDEVLHRHPDKRIHKRVPTHQLVPKAPKVTSNHSSSLSSLNNNSAKKKNKKKSENCRCGTGATKGTLGEPCSGNRCPCFGEGRGCYSCGCKNCQNPHSSASKRSKHNNDLSDH